MIESYMFGPLINTLYQLIGHKACKKPEGKTCDSDSCLRNPYWLQKRLVFFWELNSTFVIPLRNSSTEYETGSEGDMEQTMYSKTFSCGLFLLQGLTMCTMEIVWKTPRVTWTQNHFFNLLLHPLISGPPLQSKSGVRRRMASSKNGQMIQMGLLSAVTKKNDMLMYIQHYLAHTVAMLSLVPCDNNA